MIDAIQKYCFLSVILFFPITSFAGMQATHHVKITSTYMSGSLSAVRNSIDNTQFIGCRTNIEESGLAEIYCVAMDNQGTSKYCKVSFPSESLIAIVSGINTTSNIKISFENTDCTRVEVENYSLYIR